MKKTIILEKIECGRKRGRPNMRWMDSILEVIGPSLQELLSRAVENRTFWISLIQASEMTQWLNGTYNNTHKNHPV